MKYPLVLVNTQQINVAKYDNEQALQNYIEAIDVINNEYTLYDSDGQIIDLGVKVKRIKLLTFLPINKELLFFTETNKFDSRALRESIRLHIINNTNIKIGSDELESLDLESLIKLLG